MADNTAIEWTDATWNPVTGCSIVSPGCTNCYAMRLAGTRLKHTPSRAGLTKDTKAGPVWNGQVRFNEGWLDQPLRWKRPRRIFVCAHGDLFAENVPDEWIDRVFAVMALSPQHTFQVLTKRAARMRAYCDNRGGGVSRRVSMIAKNTLIRWPLPNVWLGVSAERQQEADERIPDLLATPAAIRFVSAEPLLGPIDFTRIVNRDPAKFSWLNYWPRLNALTGNYPLIEETRDPHPERLHWIIVGGESGPGARPMHPAWARAIRDQCVAAGVPFFFKQWGEWVTEDQSPEDIVLPGTSRRHWGISQPSAYNVGKRRAGRLLDGIEHNGFPGIAEVPFQ